MQYLILNSLKNINYKSWFMNLKVKSIVFIKVCIIERVIT